MYQEIDSDKIDINAEPPTEEPARQYYYMAKCREWVKEFNRKNGRFPKSCVITFGCQMNSRDSEKLAGILKEIGYTTADSEDADFVIYNTCTVRENANNKVYGHLGVLNNYKKKNKNMMIALCGCMMQEPQVIEHLQESFGFVDIIFGTHNLYKLAELLYRRIQTQKMVVEIFKDSRTIMEDLPVDRKYPFKSGVNIMFGCDNFCSYCIVPYVRGREKSREPKEILREVKRLAADGVKEVMLLGQNVNSYGKNLEHPVSFAELLRETEQIDGIERIRFMTSHPKDLSDELIEVMAQSKKICRHFHLPLQSGSDRILKRMNRRYTKAHYLELVDKLKTAMSDISLTTDIIVGFPGETEEDFSETLDAVDKAGFDSAYTFLYSKRTGTAAAAMEDQVEEAVAKKRFDRLLLLVNEISHKLSKRFEGKVMEVLVEDRNDHDSRLLTGRMGNNMLVHFPGDASLIGNIVKVRLDESRGFYYMGTML